MSAALYPESPEAPLFSDGIGDRVVSTDGATGDLVQVLRINPALTAVPSFEFALRERVARLANFRHGYYARVRRVDRSHNHATGLSIVSDHVEGTRLSDILRVANERGLLLDINAAVCLIRQLVPAVALLHENARDVAHGLIAPERLLVTPHARLVIAEHVMGAAIEQMQYGRERLWNEFRVAMPASAGLSRFDQRADVAGIGVVALSLILGRPLTNDEYPRGLNDLLNEARERTALGDEQPLSPAMRTWLARALQVDVRRAFASAPEALSALDQLAAEGNDYVAAPVALETFLSRYIAALLTPAAPKPGTPAPVQTPTPAPAPIPVYGAGAYSESVAATPVVPTPTSRCRAPSHRPAIRSLRRSILRLRRRPLPSLRRRCWPRPPPVMVQQAPSLDAILQEAAAATRPLFDPEKPFGSPEATAEARGRFDESAASLEAELAAVTTSRSGARASR